MEVYEGLLEKISALNFKDVDTHGHIKTLFKEPGFLWGRKWVPIDNAFWELTNQISQVYLEELHKACGTCVLPHPNEIEAEAKNLIAQGWLKKKSVGLKDAILFRYVGEFTGLGARYGVLAGAAKVAGELMEDALLVVFKMPGAHFLCEAITFMIAYNSGSVLSYLRNFTYAKHFNSNSWLMTVRMAVTAHYVRRSLSRARIEIPEFSINLKELEHLKEEAPDNKWIYRLSGRHRIDSFIAVLDRQIQKLKLRNQFGSAQKEVKAMIELRERVYNGRRYKRFILLKKRNSARTLSPFATDLRPITQGSHFWMLEVKNEILGPITQLDGEQELEKMKKSLMSEDILRQMQDDVISRQQIEPFDTESSKLWGAALLQSLDQISDISASPKTRYFKLQFLESFLGQVLPRIIGEIAEHGVEELSPKEKVFKDVFHFQWKISRLSYFADQYVDFVRSASLAKTRQDLTLKYHIRDYFLELLKTYEEISRFSHFDSRENLLYSSQKLSVLLDNLNANRFWIEKSTQPTFWPNMFHRFGLGAPRCEDIYH